MYCPNCGTPNTPGAEKCINCGKPLPRTSPTGEPMPVENKGQAARPNDWPGTGTAQPSGPTYNQPPANSSPYGYNQPPTGNNPPYGYNQPPVANTPYGYNPPPAAGAYGQYVPGPGQGTGTYGYGNPAPAPYYNYSTPADQVGIAPVEVGFWTRLGAYLIDALIVGFVISLLVGIPTVTWAIGFFNKYQNELYPVCDSGALGYDSVACNTASRSILLDRGELGAVLGITFGALAVGLVLYGLYYAVLTSRTGATIGKRVFGLKVVRADGTLPGFWRSLLRYTIGYWVSSLFFSLGFIWIAFDPNKQGWHDKIAGTYVVRAR